MNVHASDPITDEPYAYKNKRVLLVEDDRLISMLAVDLMKHRGIHVLGPAETLRQAEEMAASEEIDAAILDVNLGAETSFPAAAILKERGIPFFYTTALVNLRHPEIVDAASLAKPYGVKQFFQTLERALRSRWSDDDRP